MIKNALLFYLAALVVSVGFSLIPAIGSLNAPSTRPVKVTIWADGDVHDLVKAIASVNRSDVELHTYPPIRHGALFTLRAAPIMAFGLMAISALVLGVYKWLCRRFGLAAAL